MKEQIKNGGQAFPRNYAYMNPEAGRSELKSLDGMSLRDWFAGMALMGLNVINDNSIVVPDPEDKAIWAYRDADAMIAERKKDVK